jgi:hypothetical protein
MSLLFEEVDVVEEVSPQQEPIKEQTIELVEAEPKAEVMEVFEQTELPIKSKSVFVDSDDDFEAPKIPQEVKEKEIKPSHPAPDYEFSSNISPIFGKIPEKEREPILVQSKIELETEESILGTIISPIYGITKQKQVKLKVEKPTVISGNMSLEDILEINEPTEITMEQMAFHEEDVDEAPPESEAKEDILMQLFKEDEQ